MVSHKPIVWSAVCLCCLFCILFTFSPPKAKAQSDPNLIISEIMFDSKSKEDDWEWIEIYNAGSSSVDLAGYVVDDGNTRAHSAANIGSGTIGAGQSAVLYNSDDVSAADFRAAWGDVDLIAVTGWSRISLNNSFDDIAIWSSFDSYAGDHQTQANAVERVEYFSFISGWPDPPSGGGPSIYLKSLSADNNSGANWALSTVGGDTPVFTGYQALPLGNNSGLDIGSPGQPPEPEPTITPTETPTATQTETAVPTETQTPTAEPTATETFVPTPTETAIPTETQPPTAEPTATQTLVPTPTETAVPTETQIPTAEPTATQTLVPTPTETAVLTETQTPTAEPTATQTLVPTPTETAVPTETQPPTAEPTATQTLVPTPTETAVPTETQPPTAEPTATQTLILTPTETVIPTETQLPTAEPTATQTLFPTPTETVVPTETQAPTAEPTATETLIPTPTETVVPTETQIPTAEPIATQTLVPTSTETVVPTETQSPTAEPAATQPPIPPPVASVTPEPAASPTADPITNLDETIIFLPVQSKAIEPETADQLPDLIIDSISYKETGLKLTIKNAGPGPVKNTFWVDLFINPMTAPVKPNDTLEWLGQTGYVWGLDEDALPILPGQKVVLEVGGSHFSSFYSNYTAALQAGDRLVAHIDSAHAETNFGAVLETHEQAGDPYNNIFTEVLK